MPQKDKTRRTGLRLRRYCDEHEAYVEDRMNDGGADEKLLSLHALKIEWLQHERHVHLIVLLFTALVFLFSVGLFIAILNPLVLLLIAITLALVAAYMRHYFYLENTVQAWYVLYDRLYEKTRQ